MNTFSNRTQSVLVLLGVATLLVFSLSGGLGGAGATSPRLASAASDCDPQRSIQVSGSALVLVAPDRALVQLGVQSNDSSPERVQKANTAAIQRVIKALQAQGVQAKDIATDHYIIEPVYESYDSLYIKGYRINNLVAVTVRQVDQTSTIIAAALEAGANQVVNVEFTTSELRKYRDQARQLAMKAASEKAQALASAAGAETGCVLHISENTWSYYSGWWCSRNANQWAQNVVQNSPASAPNESASLDEEGMLSLGQIQVRAEVSASYSLK